MGNLGTGVKTAFLKGLEALGKTASSLTDAAQHKLNEMNLDNRRREVLLEIPKCVMQLWKDGAELPEPLAALLTELTDVEQQLAAMRAQREAKNAKATEPAPEEEAEEVVEEAVKETAEEAGETADDTVEEAEETAVEADDPEEAAEEAPVCECGEEPCCEEAAETETVENE